MIYGNILEELRNNAAKTQEFMAKLIGIDRSVYGQYERETTIMPLKHLNTICNYFDVSFDYIFGLSKKTKYCNSREDIDKISSGKRIKQLRKSIKLSQKSFGQPSDISYGTVAGYEKGRYLISTQFLYDISRTYNISSDYLLFKIDDKKIS